MFKTFVGPGGKHAAHKLLGAVLIQYEVGASSGKLHFVIIICKDLSRDQTVSWNSSPSYSRPSLKDFYIRYYQNLLWSSFWYPLWMFRQMIPPFMYFCLPSLFLGATLHHSYIYCSLAVKPHTYRTIHNAPSSSLLWTHDSPPYVGYARTIAIYNL